eukprot:TRINITY_DN12480_c3_g1_i2.p1 TRINITY_DN12480_c3_g1~~TRINITY_DN12480_c3_g1_i2.p1  ORF type:complete len:128 (+),score=19.43 TRINITY_DN12480_c3_g1_i2:53-436(+)
MTHACLNIIAASSDFNDDDFVAELNRRRQERADQERLHAQELRKQHEARQAKEQAERRKIIDVVNAQKREEEEKERKRKVMDVCRLSLKYEASVYTVLRCIQRLPAMLQLISGVCFVQGDVDNGTGY